MGLAGGPIPVRVDAEAKRQLLAVVDQACSQGWTLKRICGVLELEVSRVWRWRRRAEAGVDGLIDQLTRAPMHGITPDEEAAILAIAEEFKDIDRSHRKLAHRGSYEHRVWVSPSTFRRVLAAQRTDAQALADDARRRGWDDEVDRHLQLIERLDALISHTQAS